MKYSGDGNTELGLGRSDEVFGEGSAGVVGASGAGRGEAVGASEVVAECEANGGSAVEVGVSGGSVVLLAVEPGEAAA